MGVAQELCSFILSRLNISLIGLPGPVALRDARHVHARLVTEERRVLQRAHDDTGAAAKGRAHEAPGKLARGIRLEAKALFASPQQPRTRQFLEKFLMQ